MHKNFHYSPRRYCIRRVVIVLMGPFHSMAPKCEVYALLPSYMNLLPFNFLSKLNPPPTNATCLKSSYALGTSQLFALRLLTSTYSSTVRLGCRQITFKWTCQDFPLHHTHCLTRFSDCTPQGRAARANCKAGAANKYLRAWRPRTCRFLNSLASCWYTSGLLAGRAQLTRAQTTS